MEGQFYLMGIAGLAVSLAGFSSLLTLFRAPHAWDAVTLWRAKTIVRSSLDTASAALVPVPVFYLTGSLDWAIRAGTALLVVLSITTTLRYSPKRQPQAWPAGYPVATRFYVPVVVFTGLSLLNLIVASLGLLLVLLVAELGNPAGIFRKVVEEFQSERRVPGSD